MAVCLACAVRFSEGETEPFGRSLWLASWLGCPSVCIPSCSNRAHAQRTFCRSTQVFDQTDCADLGAVTPMCDPCTSVWVFPLGDSRHEKECLCSRAVRTRNPRQKRCDRGS